MVQKAEIKVSADTKQAIDEIRKLPKEVRTAAKEIQGSWDDARKGAMLFGAGLTAISAGGALLIRSTTTLAARVQTLGTVLYTVGMGAGYTKKQLDDLEQAVKDQGITTQAARTSLIQLAQAEIDLAQSVDLARIAQNAAVIAGINSSEAYERMIWAINTLNPRILRTMGLTISLEQAYAQYAKTTGKTAEQITMEEKKMIALNAVKEAGVRITGAYTDAMTTAGKQMTSLPRYIEEARLAIGNEFLPAFSAVIMAVTDLLNWFNALEPYQKRFAAYMLASTTALTGLTGGLLLFGSNIMKIAAPLAGVGNILTTLVAPGGIAAARAMIFATGAATTLSMALKVLIGATAVGLILLGVAAAASALAQAARNAREAKQQLREELDKTAHTAARTSGTYEDYRNNLFQLAEQYEGLVKIEGEYYTAQGKLIVLNRQNAMGIAHASVIIEGYSEAVHEANRMTYKDGLTKIEYTRLHGGLASQMKETTDAIDDEAAALEELKRQTELAAEVMEMRLTNALQGVQTIMGLDMRESLLTHQESIAELTTTNEELGVELDALVTKYTRWYGKIEDWPAAKVKEIGELQATIDANKNAIGRENEAWSTNTREMLFNLATRQLHDAYAIAVREGAMTSAEAIRGETAATIALGETFGMFTPEEAAMFNDVGEAVARLVEDPVQVENFAKSMEILGIVHGDIPGKVKPASESLAELNSIIGSMPESLAREYTFKAIVEWNIPAPDVGQGKRGTGGGGRVTTGTTSGGAYGYQHGGFWGGGHPIAVGERGEEWVVPTPRGGYAVYDAATVRKLKRYGMAASRGLAAGGVLPGGIGSTASMGNLGLDTVHISPTVMGSTDNSRSTQITFGEINITTTDERKLEAQLAFEDMLLRSLEELI